MCINKNFRHKTKNKLAHYLNKLQKKNCQANNLAVYIYIIRLLLIFSS